METSSFLKKTLRTLGLSRPSSKASTKAGRTEESYENFRDISVIKSLSKAKFSVYLAQSRLTNQPCAVKFFPYSNGNPHISFLNESRFSFLNHPHVIKTYHSEQKRETVHQNTSVMVSYTIMEYAPYGDLHNILEDCEDQLDDKLIRTLFRQFIEGLEYLHKNKVSHMDLKLENLLIGENLHLKIADFDLSCFENEQMSAGKGTVFYRAPEVIQGKCLNSKAADIYSAGIILFTLKCKGLLPHTEDKLVAGTDFAALLYTRNDEFWSKHCEVQNKERAFFDKDFKELFNAMVKLSPEERLTVAQIKKSKWYNGPVYTQEQVKARLSKLRAGQ